MSTETLRFVLTAKDDASKVLHGMGGAFGVVQKAGLVAFAAIGVAAGAVLVVLKKSLSAFTDYMGNITAVQRLTGMNTKATSDYVGVLKLMGIAQKAGGTAVKFLGKNMDAALQGTKPMIEAFKRLGVSLKDAAGHALPVGTVLWKVRDALAALPAGAAKTGLALKLFGRGGTELMKFFAASPAAMKGYLAYIKSLGMEMGGKSLKLFKDYMKAQHMMGFAWEAIKVKIGEVLAKPLTKYFKEIGVWVAANMPSIRKWLRDAADTLADWAPKLVKIIKQVVDFTAKLWPWRDVIAKVLVAIVALAVAVKIFTVAMGILNVVMSANPIGLIVIAIAALVIGFIVLWKKCAWFRDFWKAVWSIVKKEFALVWTFIKPILQTMLEGMTTVWHAIKAVVTWFWGWAGPYIKAAVRAWWTVIKAVFGTIISGARTDWAILVAVVRAAIRAVIAAVHTIQAIVGFVRAVFNSVKSVATTIGHAIATTVGNIWRGIKNTAKSVWDGIVGVVKAAWNGIAGFVNKIILAINWVVTKVPGMGSVGKIPSVPSFSSSSTKGNGGAGSSSGGYGGRGNVSTPKVMDNEGMGGPLDAVGHAAGGALGAVTGWVSDLWNSLNISSHLPQPIGGLFGGVTDALLDMVKDAIMGLLKKFGGGGGMEIVDFAKSMIGVPYLWGGTSPAGFDCSGLIYWAYMQAGKSIPRVPTNGGRQISRDQIQPADVMFYYPNSSQHGAVVPFGHFKMYAGGGQTIESTTGGVQMHPADWGGAAQIRRYLKKGGGAFGPASGYLAMLHGRETVVAHDNPTRGLRDLAKSGIASQAQQGDSYVFEGCLFSQDFDTVIAEANQRGAVKIGRRTGRTRAMR